MKLTEVRTVEGKAYINLEEVAGFFPPYKDHKTRVVTLKGGFWFEVLDTHRNITIILNGNKL